MQNHVDIVPVARSAAAWSRTTFADARGLVGGLSTGVLNVSLAFVVTVLTFGLGQAWAQDLEVPSWRCEIAHRYITLRGEVTNVSNRPLRNVMAVAVFRTAAGTFVKSADALVDYNPIMPDQASPFSVSTTHNPEIEKCSVSFKFLMGAEIDSIDRSKETKKRQRARAEKQRRENKAEAKRSNRAYLQKKLNELGYDAGPEDGVIGERTEEAIRAFQRAIGGPVDGKYSAQLLSDAVQRARDKK